MKRRYKIGDWFRVPLPGALDAVGIITHACRSRLFGYFFPVEAARVPSPEELKGLCAGHAVACLLFGGAGLEQARWTLIATSLPFDSASWPFPQFASRGVFGRTWRRVTYDPETMSVAQRETLPSWQADELPDARFATPEELEGLLQLRIAGEAPETPLVVCEVRSPLDIAQFEPLLSRGGRVQFSEPLKERDLQSLAAFVNEHPHVELRLHGFASFDLTALRAFSALRSLVLDIGALRNAEALASLKNLESLRIGTLDEPSPLGALEALPQLHRLEIRGRKADVQNIARLRSLESLAIVDTPPLEFREFASAMHLRSLTVAHVQGEIQGLSHLRALERLALRDLQLTELPVLSDCPRLHSIELRNITLLRDLAPLRAAPALRELRIEGMPQLHVSDFEPLGGNHKLQNVTIEIGSKTKSREVYRLLRRGKSTE